MSEKTDGLLMKYFVLKPRGTGPYADASRAGMFAYANSIRGENPALAIDLDDWAKREIDASLEATDGE